MDGSKLSEYALELGLEVARRLGSRVTLLRVLPAAEVTPAEARYLESQEEGLSQRPRQCAEKEAQAYLQ